MSTQPKFRNRTRGVTDGNGLPTLRPTRKVAVTAVTGAVLAIIGAGLLAITPDMLSWAGPWVPVVMAVIITTAAYLVPNGETK
jgi:hypothetical protein